MSNTVPASNVMDQTLESVLDSFIAEGGGNLRTLARLQTNQRLTGYDYRRVTKAMMLALKMATDKIQEVKAMEEEAQAPAAVKPEEESGLVWPEEVKTANVDYPDPLEDDGFEEEEEEDAS